MCPPLLATPITNERGERLPFPYSVQSHAETHSRLSDSISLRDCRPILYSGVGDTPLSKESRNGSVRNRISPAMD